jgi:preprotein translocase subunit SecA
VGTSNVQASEELSAQLERAGVPHQVLSAQQDREEADVIARAGEPGRVTVATRMAGRGTDIQMDPEVVEHGGLAVVAAELSEARRIDRQLFGRCGRQGEPGSFEQLTSLEDALLETHLPGWLRRAMTRSLFPRRLVVRFTRWAQRAEERRSALARRRLLESERILEQLLAFSGRGE